MYEENILVDILPKNGASGAHDVSSNNIQVTEVGTVRTSIVDNKKCMCFTPNNYLTIPTNKKFNLTGDFTIEFWLKCTSKNQSSKWPAVLCTKNSWQNDSTCILVCSQDWHDQIGLTQKTFGDYYAVPYNFNSIAQYWNHVAMVCHNKKYSIYYNGKKISNPSENHYTNGLNLNINGILCIGHKGLDCDGYYGSLYGYLAELKISDIALYTENFEIQRSLYDQISTPDVTWQRISYTHSCIIYYAKDNWKIYENEGCYNGSCTYNNNGKIKFIFFGSKLRIIAVRNNVETKNAYINIDGNIFNINLYTEVESYCNMVFEKTDLEAKEHHVEIYKDESDTDLLNLEAVDIDNDGFIMSEQEYNYIQTLKPNIDTDILISKLLKENLPDTVANKIALLFTEDKGLYINKQDGSLININHNHNNEDALDLITKNENGDVLFNGKELMIDNNNNFTKNDEDTIIAKVFSDSNDNSLI